MLYLSKKKMMKEEIKSQKIEQLCGGLAYLKAHPADVWLRWTRRPRKLSKKNHRDRPERRPARYLTEMVDGKMVTKRIMKATPINRAALRSPYPVLSAEQQKAWDAMAEIETGVLAWDDDSSLDGADLDLSRDLLDQIRSGLHSELAELGQEDPWGMSAAITTRPGEAEAEPKLKSVPNKTNTEKANVKAKASDGQGKKRKREGDDDDDDDSLFPVKKASKQQTAENGAAFAIKRSDRSTSLLGKGEQAVPGIHLPVQLK